MATLPLWQLTQVPRTWLWSTRARGSQARVVWQVWQASELAMCPAGLPAPLAALWQLTQAVPSTLTWLNPVVGGLSPGMLAGVPVVARSPVPVLARAPVVPVARVGVGVGVAAGRSASLSREEWQPEPPQSWVP